MIGYASLRCQFFLFFGVFFLLVFFNNLHAFFFIWNIPFQCIKMKDISYVGTITNEGRFVKISIKLNFKNHFIAKYWPPTLQTKWKTSTPIVIVDHKPSINLWKFQLIWIFKKIILSPNINHQCFKIEFKKFKTLTSMDIVHYRTVNKCYDQSVLGYHRRWRMCDYFQRTKIFNWKHRIKDRHQILPLSLRSPCCSALDLYFV